MEYNINNYKTKPLPDVLEFIVDNRGKTVPTTDKGHMLIATNCIRNESLYPKYEKVRYLSDEIYNTWFRAHPKAGDIIFVNKGTPGKVCLVPDPVDFCIAQDMMSFRCDEKIIYNKFLLAFLRSPKIQNQILNSQVGTTIPHFKKEQLKELKVPILPMEIQKKIGNFYYRLCMKIELNNKITDKLYEIGKAYYQKWAESCVEEIAIKEVAEEILDYTKNFNNKVKLINSSDVTRGNFIKFNFVENKELKGHFKKNFKKYDILYSQIRPRNHHYGYVLFDDTNNYLASTRLMVIRNKKEKISSSVLYFSVISNEAIEDFTVKTESRSGTFPQGNYEDLSSYKIKYKTEQEEITNLLNSILEKIYSNQLEIQNLENLRDTLLPKLMNGEIDLDKIEI